MKAQTLRITSWLLAGAAVSAAALVWVSERIDGKPLSLYDIFPLLGLLAFSLMWTHYILGGVRRFSTLSAKDNKNYFRLTSIVVLACILLHPTLLMLQLNRDGYGLPPSSYLQVYSEPVMKGAIMLGTISLVIFLMFEFKRKFRKKSWWKYVDWAQNLAMLLILYHGLTLGRELSVGWFKAVWIFYGITFVGAALYNHWYDSRVVGKKEAK